MTANLIPGHQVHFGLLIPYFCITLFCIQCNASRSKHAESKINADGKPYRKIARDKYKNGVVYIFNTQKTHVLCVKKVNTEKNFPFPPLAFFLYDLQKDKIRFEDASAGGEVKWLNDSQIIVSWIPGTVKGDEEKEGMSTGYIYDLIQQKKITNKDALQHQNIK